MHCKRLRPPSAGARPAADQKQACADPRTGRPRAWRQGAERDDRTMNATVRIGISGWTYDRWRGTFFPPKLARRAQLRYAAGRFDSIEINGTFYGLLAPDDFAKFHDETPDDFVFAVKAPRFITHMLRARDLGTPLVELPRVRRAAARREAAARCCGSSPSATRSMPPPSRGFLARVAARHGPGRATSPRRHDDRPRKGRGPRSASTARCATPSRSAARRSRSAASSTCCASTTSRSSSPTPSTGRCCST